MEKTDKYLYDILNNKENFDEYIRSFAYTRQGIHKKYQVIAFDDLKLGFIVKDQRILVTVFEDDVNMRLSRFIGESSILVEEKGGHRVPSYYFTYITFPGINNVECTRSLSKIFLLVNGIKVDNCNEAHHDLHTMIHTRDTILYITRRENASRRPKLSTKEQALGYIRNDIMKIDKVSFEIFYDEMMCLAQRYDNHRGIYASGINILEDINKATIDYNVQLSGL